MVMSYVWDLPQTWGGGIDTWLKCAHTPKRTRQGDPSGMITYLGPSSMDTGANRHVQATLELKHAW